MADLPPFKPRSTLHPGVTGFLQENCDIIYSSVFSPQSIGRISDLICGKLGQKIGDHEIQVRSALLFTLFEGTFAGKLAEAPVSLECGTDGTHLAIGTTFITEPHLLQASPLVQGDLNHHPKSPVELCLNLLRQTCHHVYLKIYSQGNQVELIGILSLAEAALENTHGPIHVIKIDQPASGDLPTGSYTELGDLDYEALLSESNGIPSDQKKIKTGNLLAKSVSSRSIQNETTRIKGVTEHNDSEKIVVESEKEFVITEEVTLEDTEKPSPEALEKQKRKNKELKEKLFKYKKNGQLTDDVAILIEKDDEDSLDSNSQFFSLKEKNKKLADSLTRIQTEEHHELVKSVKQFKLDEQEVEVAKLIDSPQKNDTELAAQNEALRKKIAEYQAREAKLLVNEIKDNSTLPKNKSDEEELEYYKSKLSKIKVKAEKTFSTDPDLIQELKKISDPDSDLKLNKKVQIYKDQLANLHDKIDRLQKEKEKIVRSPSESGTHKKKKEKSGIKKISGMFKKLFSIGSEESDLGEDDNEDENSHEELDSEANTTSDDVSKKPSKKSSQKSKKKQNTSEVVSEDSEYSEETVAIQPEPAHSKNQDNSKEQEDHITPDDFMKEIEQGGLSKIAKSIVKEEDDADSEDKSNPNQDRYKGLMSEVAAEKTRLLELAKKLHQSIRQKELSFQNREQSYQTQIAKVNEDLRQRETAVNHFKNQYTQTQILVEQMKKEKESNADDLQYKHKYLQQQKMLNTLKEENLTIQKKYDELKAQSVANKASQKVKNNTQEVQDLSLRLERANKQAEEYKKHYQSTLEKLNAKNQAAANPDNNPEELKRRYESALKVATIAKKDAENMKAKLDDMKRDEVKNRLELAKAQEEIKRLQQALMKATPGGGRKPPKAA